VKFNTLKEVVKMGYIWLFPLFFIFTINLYINLDV